MDFFTKAVRAGMTPANVVSWLSLQWMNHVGLWTGTARIYLKAALLGIKLGTGVRAHGKVGLLRWPGGRIEIGDRVSMISSWRRATAASLYAPARLRVFGAGAAILIGPDCQLSGVSITARSTAITLGRQVLIGPNSIIVDSDFHAPWPPEARASAPGSERDAPVTIGDFAWLGMNCIILKGVNIGAGAIIGAGSVVTRNIPPNTIAAGNPARPVKSLP